MGLEGAAQNNNRNMIRMGLGDRQLGRKPGAGREETSKVLWQQLEISAGFKFMCTLIAWLLMGTKGHVSALLWVQYAGKICAICREQYRIEVGLHCLIRLSEIEISGRRFSDV